MFGIYPVISEAYSTRSFGVKTVYYTALFRLVAAVNGGDDLLLFLRLYTDGIERLPCATIRADEGLVVNSGKSSGFTVGATTPWADLNPYNIILFHIRIPPGIYHRPQAECLGQSKRCRSPQGRCPCRNPMERRLAFPHA